MTRRIRLGARIGGWLVLAALIGWPASAAAAPAHWTAGRARGTGNLIEVACPSATLCVAVNNAGGVAVSRDPAAGASSWHLTRGLTLLQLGGTLKQQTTAAEIDTMAHDLSCPSTHLCVIGVAGAEQTGRDPGIPAIAQIAYSTDPAGPASAWHVVSGIDGNAGQVTSLSCPSVSVCHALVSVTDRHGDVDAVPLVTHTPTGPATAWKRAGTTVGAAPQGLDCPTVSLCVTATDPGIYATANALSPAAHWRFAAGTGNAGQIDWVTCASAGLCIAAPDEAGCVPCGAGNDLLSTAPASGVWRRAGAPTGDLACPATTFCVGLAQGTHHTGQDFVDTTDPSGPASAWHYIAGPRLGRGYLRAIACASATQCTAVGDGGEIAVGGP